MKSRWKIVVVAVFTAFACATAQAEEAYSTAGSATIENVDNETYAFRRPLQGVTKGQPQGKLKEFGDCLLSAMVKNRRIP